jgi:hypothetical protein
MRKTVDIPAFVQCFANHARLQHERTGKEAVAIIGLSPDGALDGDPGFVFCGLDNTEHHKHYFCVPWDGIAEAVKWCSQREPGCRIVLAHSHFRGAASPSNVFGRDEDGSGGDVQQLGDPLWIRDVNRLLERHGLPTPMLHLVYATERGRWRLCEIDQRIGPPVKRKRRGKTVQVNKGWREVRRG